jgi:hypothetical protein
MFMGVEGSGAPVAGGSGLPSGTARDEVLTPKIPPPASEIGADEGVGNG